MEFDQREKGRLLWHEAMGRQFLKHYIQISPTTPFVDYHCKHSAACTILFLIYEIMHSCTHGLKEDSRQRSRLVDRTRFGVERGSLEFVFCSSRTNTPLLARDNTITMPVIAKQITTSKPDSAILRWQQIYEEMQKSHKPQFYLHRRRKSELGLKACCLVYDLQSIVSPTKILSCAYQ